MSSQDAVDLARRAARKAMGEQSSRNGPAAAPLPREDAGARPRESASTRLVRLAHEAGLHLYHDKEQSPYADVVIGGMRQTWSLRSGTLRDWLARLAHRCEGRVPASQAIADALVVLRGQALYDGPERPVAVRVAAQ